jgi:endoglucanase
MMRALLLILLSNVSVAAAATTAIKVDQIGYLPNAPKLAFVVSDKPASEFLLRKAEDSSIVFRGRLSPPVDDADSGERVHVADFSLFRTEGRFFLESLTSATVGPLLLDHPFTPGRSI